VTYGAIVLRFTGIIEGFYGPPWTWDDRAAVGRFCAERGADTYVYAPKSDPLHRDEWRTPYGTEMLDAFARLVTDGGLRVGFAVSPGLSMQLDDPADRSVLAAKFAALASVGVDLFCLALDDIAVGPDAARAQGDLCAWLRDEIGDAELVLVPTDYTTCRPNAYLDGLAESVPSDVPIGWTGPTVVADRITVADARARADALGGRAPWLWDNYPVNDGIMTERLFMGPLPGREPGLRDELSGYLANPMLQARASQVPLASALAWCRGDDPVAAWLDAATELDCVDFARACDDTHLRSLFADRDALVAYLGAAAECGPGGLGDEVMPWVEQVRREAAAARDLLTADPARGVEHRLAPLAAWTRFGRAKVSVFGPRRSLRPVIAQDDELRFVERPGLIDHGRNAIDDLVVAITDGGAIDAGRFGGDR
jgi:hypothetical protein